MRRIVIVAIVLSTISLAGCADNQPGDTNTGPGVATDVSDLAVKVDALKNDPCLNKNVAQIYTQCGRFVTEVANIIGTFRQEQPQHGSTADALQDSVNAYQQAGCDNVNGSPSLT